MNRSQKGNNTLRDISPGAQVRIVSFNGLSATQIENLQAYGLVPGRRVRIRQHNPVTVLEVEHTELALDAELAEQIQVEKETD